MITTPLDSLKQTLAILKLAKDKSCKSFEEGKITPEKHENHIKNLEPKISSYKYAIRILETYM